MTEPTPETVQQAQKEKAYAALSFISNLLLQAHFPLSQHQVAIEALHLVESFKVQVAPEKAPAQEAPLEAASAENPRYSDSNLPFSGLAALSAEEEKNAQANLEAAKQKALYAKEQEAKLQAVQKEEKAKMDLAIHEAKLKAQAEYEETVFARGRQQLEYLNGGKS